MRLSISHACIHLSLITILFGCVESSNEEVIETVSESIEISSADSYDSLLDEAPSGSSCVGWRESLANGRRLSYIEACLREKYFNNKISAIEDARVLSHWKIQQGEGSSLKPLINSLTKYDSPAQLEAYLKSLSLLPHKAADYVNEDRLISASDFLSAKGNVHAFDVETGFFPNSHDYLMTELSELSDLNEISFSEVPPPNYEDQETPYILKAKTKKKSYQIEANNYGDWYDVDAVLQLLNYLAEAESVTSRFTTLPTGDQTTIVLVADQKQLTALLDSGLITNESSKASMARGKSAEKIIIENLLVQ